MILVNPMCLEGGLREGASKTHTIYIYIYILVKYLPSSVLLNEANNIGRLNPFLSFYPAYLLFCGTPRGSS